MTCRAPVRSRYCAKCRAESCSNCKEVLAVPAHRVHQVVGRVDVEGQAGQRLGPEQVARSHAHPGPQGLGQRVGQGEAARVAHEAHHLVALARQHGQQALADVAGSAGEQDFHGPGRKRVGAPPRRLRRAAGVIRT